jgi:hypothetical protein
VPSSGKKSSCTAGELFFFGAAIVVGMITS